MIVSRTSAKANSLEPVQQRRGSAPPCRPASTPPGLGVLSAAPSIALGFEVLILSMLLDPGLNDGR